MAMANKPQETKKRIMTPNPSVEFGVYRLDAAEYIESE